MGGGKEFPSEKWKRTLSSLQKNHESGKQSGLGTPKRPPAATICLVNNSSLLVKQGKHGQTIKKAGNKRGKRYRVLGSSNKAGKKGQACIGVTRCWVEKSHPTLKGVVLFDKGVSPEKQTQNT